VSTLKERIRSGEVVFGGTVSEHLRPSVVKAFRDAGFDFIYMENEHASFEPSRLSDFVLCARDNGLTVVTKIPQLERGETARLLEMGVMGLQLPRTESRQEVETLRSYIKFPPDGTRASATGYGNSMYAKPADKRTWYNEANAETLLVGHIETRTGADKADEINSAEDLDVCFVGISDLSLDLGMPGRYTDPEFQAAVQRIIDASEKHNVVRGLPGLGYDQTKYWIDHGVQFFECADELDLIRRGAARAFEELQRARAG
jgi:4-hydroxy-2-oxoheptanedioate aldolase